MMWCTYIVQLHADFRARPLDFIRCLQVHPVPRAVAKVVSEPDRGVCRDSALAKNDLIDAPWWHAERTRELVLTQAVGFKVLILQCFTWM